MRLVLGNVASRGVATLRPNGRPTEKEALLITPVRVNATFSLWTRRKSKRRMPMVAPLMSGLGTVLVPRAKDGRAILNDVLHAHNDGLASLSMATRVCTLN